MIGFKLSNVPQQRQAVHDDELSPKAQAMLELAAVLDEEMRNHAACILRHEQFKITLRIKRKLDKIYVKYYEPEV